MHALKAASWVAVAADLNQPGWVHQLVVQGLNPSQPVVWVAEGLLMYLTQAAVERLLQACILPLTVACTACPVCPGNLMSNPSRRCQASRLHRPASLDAAVRMLRC